MSAIRYTPAQRTAVFYPDGNLLLSAAAGSGKTAALTGRIVELIREDRASLSEMLIVTFTRAAAAEMRTRISSKLAALAEESRSVDPAEAARLSRSLAALPSADISTIHAFLYKALRPYFPLLGLPSDARIAETRTTDAMKREAMRETVDEFFRQADKGDGSRASFPELADIIGQARDTDAIDAELLWLADRLLTAGLDERALLVFADSLDGFAKDGAANLMNTAFGKVIREELGAFFRHYRAIFAGLREEFEGEPEVLKAYGPTADGMLAWLGDVSAMLGAEKTDYEALNLRLRSLASYVPARLGTLAKKNATETSELFKNFRDEMKKALDRHILDPFFSGTEDEARTAAHTTARILRCSAQVIGEFLRRFRNAKAARALLDYNDLEWFALQILLDGEGNPTKAAEEIGSRYRYVFVDEYQDTNGVQDRIFRSICGQSIRFLVGDVKQSIYRFRGADPSVFTGYRRAWENQPPCEEGETPNLPDEWNPSAGRSLFMSENFRCAKPVIDFTNCVSEYLLPHSGTPFSDGDRLIHAKGEEFAAPPVEVCLIETKSQQTEPAEAAEPAEDTEEEQANPEAIYVARRIASMVGRYLPDGKILRPSDVAILLRSPSSTGGDYRNALAELGIPSRMKTEQPLGAFPSVMLLMCLLNFVDNPLRDIYAAGALRSPVFGFSLSDLVRLKEQDGSLTLWESLTAAAESELFSEADEPQEADLSANEADEILREKCVRAVQWLRRHKTVAGGMSAEKYLEFLIRDADLYSVPGIRGNGPERDAVQKFTHLAQTYEQNSRGSGVFGGLSGFLDFAADELESTESSDEDGASPSDDSVAILSIHASKGLEFPVCFVSECAKSRNTADETRTVLFDPSLGLGMSLPDEGGLTKCDTLVKKAVSEKIRRESVDEEMRMLYVALTRAETRLIVTAKTSDAEKAQADAAVQAEFTDGYHVSHTKNYLGWILEALAKHPIPDSVKLVTVPLNGADDPAEIPADPEACMTADSEEEAAPAERLTKDDYLARFTYRYPDSYRNKIPAKLTVSRLHPQILDEEDETPDLAESAKSAEKSPGNEKKPPARPDFLLDSEEIRRKKGSPTERGSAAHVFLQFTDYRKLKENGVQAELERLLEARYLSPAQGKLIPLEQIERFRQSKLMDSLLRSDFVRREFRFNVRMPAENFTEDPELAETLRENGEKITVQGVVDCVFRDPDTGKLTLIDYKTDTFTAEEWRDRKKAEAKLRERHTRQLTYYREICEKLFGEKIEKAMVYATAMGMTVEI